MIETVCHGLPNEAFQMIGKMAACPESEKKGKAGEDGAVAGEVSYVSAVDSSEGAAAGGSGRENGKNKKAKTANGAAAASDEGCKNKNGVLSAQEAECIQTGKRREEDDSIPEQKLRNDGPWT